MSRTATLMPPEPQQRQLLVAFLSVSFFLSGAAALIYQVAWQRQLFVNFGVDAESVAIIVSCFMLGLGIGALVGGQVADRFARRSLPIYLGIEFGIAACGLLSIWALRAVSQALAPWPEVFSFPVMFAILLIPTSLMGATLPVLGAHLTRSGLAVGSSIGSLYRANTAGAGVGALATGFVLFQHLTLQQTVAFAAAMNVLSAVVVVAWLRRERSQHKARA